MNNKNNNYSGFTLIELLVVISIVGLLSSMVLASLATARTKAQNATVQNELTQMRTTYELQYSNTNSYDALLPSGMGSGGAVFSPLNPVLSPHAGEYQCYNSIIGPIGKNYCTVFTQTGCTTLYGAGSQTEGICKVIMGSGNITFNFGVQDSSAGYVSGLPSGYALDAQSPSNPTTHYCIRSSGYTGTTTTATGCYDKINW